MVSRLNQLPLLLPILFALSAASVPASGPAAHGASRPVRSDAVSSPRAKDFAVPVLMYHRLDVLNAKERRNRLLRDLTVSPENFAKQMKYLEDQGFTVLSARDVAAAVRDHEPLPGRSVVVTFDDGYEDAYAHALPILRKYGIPATIFLVTSSVGEPGHLSWAEVSAMSAAKVDFGSHLVHHLDLTHLSPTSADRELDESKRMIEVKLKQPVVAVAYPNGKTDGAVERRVRAAGYTAGWLKSGGPVRPGSNLYELPRMRVSGSTTMAQFRRLVGGHRPGNEKANARKQAGDQTMPDLSRGKAARRGSARGYRP